MSVTITRASLRHSSRTKDYHIILIKSEDLDRAVLMTRWGRADAFGSFEIKMGSCLKMIHEYEKKFREKNGRGYTINLLKPIEAHGGYPDVGGLLARMNLSLLSKQEESALFKHGYLSWLDGFEREKIASENELIERSKQEELENLRDNFGLEIAPSSAPVETHDETWGAF